LYDKLVQLTDSSDEVFAWAKKVVEYKGNDLLYFKFGTFFESHQFTSFKSWLDSTNASDMVKGSHSQFTDGPIFDQDGQLHPYIAAQIAPGLYDAETNTLLNTDNPLHLHKSRITQLKNLEKQLL
jgi:hypothetical protein